MKETDPPFLLEQIVKITSQREQQAMQQCLIKTLQELISASEISLYSISTASGKPTLKLLMAVAKSDPAGEAAIQRRPLAIGTVEEDSDLQQCFTTKQQVVSSWNDDTGGETRTVVRVIHPITTTHGLIGFLIIKCDALVQKDQDMAKGFLRIYQNYLQLIDDSEHDALTGLSNRKTFDEKMMVVLAAQRNNGEQTSDDDSNKGRHCLAMLDLDHFKKVNDTFGHLYGDEVLMLFSRLMTQTFRGDDELFRYGGEEFVVFLQDVDLATGLMVLERFRAKVEAFSIPQVGKITVSIGVVEVKKQDLPTTVVEQADKALYFAKDNGRNQVCSYEKLIEEGKIVNTLTSGGVELF